MCCATLCHVVVVCCHVAHGRGCDVLVATPGRLTDMFESQSSAKRSEQILKLFEATETFGNNLVRKQYEQYGTVWNSMEQYGTVAVTLSEQI